MAYAFPDFVVVVCADESCYKNIAGILNKKTAVALNILSYEEWIVDGHVLPYNLLFMRSDGTWVYAKDPTTKARVKSEIQSILDRQRI